LSDALLRILKYKSEMDLATHLAVSFDIENGCNLFPQHGSLMAPPMCDPLKIVHADPIGSRRACLIPTSIITGVLSVYGLLMFMMWYFGAFD